MLEPITFVLEQNSAIAIIQPPRTPHPAPRTLRLSYDAKQTLDIVQKQGGALACKCLTEIAP